MARPTKQGVDYFPLDVHLDDKIKFVEIKYKLEGFAVVVKLIQRIYAQGYWCKWSEDETLLFSDEVKADFTLVESVVNECLKRGVFDNELFEKHGILTSKGIQKRYKEIVRKRKGVEITEEYLLIDGNFGVNGGINSIDDGIKAEDNREKGGESTQTKLNKTKINKTEEDIKEPKKPKKQIPKIKFAEFVSMTEEEHKKLVVEHGIEKVDEMIKVLDNYKGASGKTYKSDYRAILQWVVDRVKTKPGTKQNAQSVFDKYKSMEG